LELDAQQTLNNILDIQMDPFINLPNIVVDDIGDITLEPSVGLHMITNTNAPQVMDLSPSSPKAIRPEKPAKGDLDSNYALISQYLQHPRPLTPKVPMGSKLVVVVASMNRLRPPIENLSTCRVIRRKRPTILTTITFVSEHNFE
jgi:hypothetical protein